MRVLRTNNPRLPPSKELMRFDNWGYVRLCSPDGRLKKIVYFDNLVVNNGLSAVLSFLGKTGAGQSGADFIGQGEDSGPVASGDTTISTEVGSRVQACTVIAIPRYTWSVVHGSGNPAGGGSIRQIGALNSATGGTLMLKASLSQSIIKGSSDTATYIWIVSLNQ